MRFAVLCLLLCLAAVASCEGSGQLKGIVERENVSKGRQAADMLLRLIRSNAFHRVLDVVGVVGGPIAGTVTSILKMVIKGSTPKEDDLQFAREAFQEINSKLEAFTHEFQEVKSLIDWSAIQVSYGTYERAIRALKTQLQVLIEAPRNSIDDFRQQFTMKYESDFQNAAQKIYDGIVNSDLIFSRNLLEASAKYTTNHRKRVQMFSMGLIQLLLQAIEVQMAYIDLKFDNEETTKYMQTVWNNRMTVLKAKMAEFDELLAARWTQQMPADAERLVVQNRDMSPSDLALRLYYFMEDKFHWRQFVVIVYKDVTGAAQHDMTFCRGYTSLGRFGKNIVIASADSEESQFNRYEARRLVEGLSPTEKDAGHILQHVNAAAKDPRCKTYQLRFVAQESADVKTASLTMHSVMKKICVTNFWGTTCYWTVLFG